MFEEPSSPSTNAKPPMLKIRTILSGAVALLLFASTLISSLHAFNDETPGEKDNPASDREPSIYSPSHTQSSVSQRHHDEARMPLSGFHSEQDSHSGAVELDSYPVEGYQPRGYTGRYQRPGET
ncbi:hypothetical protein Q9L58_004243 [Maublancomyces gigas]|uniref:Uncharacterized protein n=1 Tax=Discina gigas TaxID=1032678 RepID=A0ABR3GLT4_9PEZI